MKLKWTVFALLSAVAALALPQAGGTLAARVQDHAAAGVGFVAAHAHDDQDKDKHKDGHDRNYSDESEFTERDEFRQTYTLAPGAAVRVSGINGSIDVETGAGSGAEVHVVRTARNKADLDYNKIIIEQPGGGLVVRGERDDEKKEGWREANRNNRQVRQRITLRIPRNVDFTASGINGRATVGELEGPVRLSGINGRVDVAQASGYTDISGINGSVTMLIAQLSERGIRVSGVNGRVELKFADTLNADLSVSGINGAVQTDGLPNVTVQGRISRQNFNARIGAGGAPINVSGVNGSVKLAPRS
jgi:hypothetical protein